MITELSKAFIFQKFAVKFYFGLSLHIFQHELSLSLENVCDSWCMHQTGFSSAAVVPQSKFTELCSSAAIVSQSKSTELCSSEAVVPQSKSTKMWSKFTELCSSAAVESQSKSTEMWSSAVPFDHDLWYFYLIPSNIWCGTHNRVGLQFKCVLTDTHNPPSPGEVGHTTRVYIPYSFRIVVWVLLHPMRTR